MIKRTYSMHGTMSDHIFFDNNCQLAKIIKNDSDFANVGLSVDIFHFKSKHKLTDTFCQENCIPASFPELKGLGDKAWYFNSSIAKQKNMWLGDWLNQSKWYSTHHKIIIFSRRDGWNFLRQGNVLRIWRVTWTYRVSQGLNVTFVTHHSQLLTFKLNQK